MSSKMIDKSFLSVDCGKKNVRSWWRTLKAKSSAVAEERLVKGVRSRFFDIKEMSSAAAEENVYIKINDRGYLDVSKESSNGSWQKSINLAPDIHSTNVHVNITIPKRDISYPEINQSIKLHLEVLKHIDKGNELLIWFSEEFLAMIDMPFLTPRNITGHKKYRCHICDEYFEYPNPLKIHLLLNCHKERSYNLWRYIEKCINAKNSTTQIISPDLNVQMIGIETKIEQEKSTSAFSPYKKQTSIVVPRREYPCPSNLNVQPLNLTVGSSLHLATQQINPTKWMTNVLDTKYPRTFEDASSNYAADVELFASNWGKLKQGHLCVYCGKVYSRKYGLKIHIRTHTGYKPLKCKYCSRPFGDPSNLNKHVRLHASGLSQYICPICGKILVRRRDLERHLKMHHVNSDVTSTSDCSIRDVNDV